MFIIFPAPMRKIVNVLSIHLLLMISFCILPNAAIAKKETIRGTFPSLPTSVRENRFQEIQKAFDERSKLYLQGRQFHSWKPNRPIEEIQEEYTKIGEWRHQTWYSEETKDCLISRTDFMVAQDLLEKGYYKRPHLLAFQYNQTDGTYNSSSIVLNGYRFLAMEAPQNEKLTSNFFNLLQNHQVTQLVRLTSSSEKGILKSMPYWNQRLKKDPKTGEITLLAPFAGRFKSYPIRYYAIDSWPDNSGVDPKLLIKLVQEVRKNFDLQHGLLACHCSGGVGRTGTFLAAFLLMEEIDKQIAQGINPQNIDISIEKIVMQLSLQRSYMVSRPAQYITLYRLVDLYVKELESRAISHPTQKM